MSLKVKDSLQVSGHFQTRPSGPPLRNGQRLSRIEFERRYEAHPEIKKAELIEGVVYVASPVRIKRHGSPHFGIITWLGTYQIVTPGVLGADNGSVRFDDENEPQPDVFLSLEPESGGRSSISEDDYLEGPPELIVEIAASSAARDLGSKRRVYARYGVPEYLMALPVARRIDWLVLRGDTYESLLPDENGILRSKIFPGLWLDQPAFLANDMQTVLLVLQQGLASPEYATFVERLSNCLNQNL